MKVQLSVFLLAIIAFLVNTVLDHLINWWSRRSEVGGDVFIVVVIYIIKSALIISGLHYITK